MSETAPVLAGFDPGPEIRRSVRGHARHVPALRRAARELSRFGPMDETRLEAALASRLDGLRRSLWRSPFYLASLRRHGLSPDDLRTLDDLRHFPTLDRETLGRAFDSVPALPPGRVGRLFVERSSGSTGRPIAVLKEDYDSVHMWAVLRFWMRRLARRLPSSPRVALLCSLPHGVEYRTNLPALGGGTLARISLARPEPAARLRAFSPHVVFTDPAGLHWLAGQDDPPRPRVLLSSAMHLSAELRRQAEAALRAPVVNYYSTAETGPLAWECRQAPGRFHVLVPDVWVESVRGELAATRLRASVLPLLRYLPGDRGDVRAGPCACGHRGASIVGLDGRRSCVFVAPDGREVDAWQLAWAFQHHALDGFRLTQQSASAFLLEIAGQPDGTAGALDRLRASLVSLGWRGPRIALRSVPRQVLSAVKPEPFRRVVPGPRTARAWNRGPSVGGLAALGGKEQPSRVTRVRRVPSTTA